jgi:hypothetical protein
MEEVELSQFQIQVAPIFFSLKASEGTSSPAALTAFTQAAQAAI